MGDPRRLCFTAVFVISLVICITCAVLEKTLSAILSFALMVVAFWEFQQRADSPKDTHEDLDLTRIAEMRGVNLESYFSEHGRNGTANKVIVKALIREYLYTRA